MDSSDSEVFLFCKESFNKKNLKENENMLSMQEKNVRWPWYN